MREAAHGSAGMGSTVRGGGKLCETHRSARKPIIKENIEWLKVRGYAGKKESIRVRHLLDGKVGCTFMERLGQVRVGWVGLDWVGWVG